MQINVRLQGAFQIPLDRFAAWPRVGHAGGVGVGIVMAAQKAAVRIT
jgi:hypothetical protein